MGRAVVLVCHGCGRSHEVDGPVARAAQCDGCGADLRCCLNCRFHDSSAYNECSEPAAERVVEKERANFCDYFTASSAPGETAAGRSGNGLAELEGLFGDKNKS
jgi:hypothetical protein